jgi:hypothetical protein
VRAFEPVPAQLVIFERLVDLLLRRHHERTCACGPVAFPVRSKGRKRNVGSACRSLLVTRWRIVVVRCQ